MPPESPKIPEAELDLVSRWIRLGLLKGKSSKSKLKSIAMGRSSAVMKSPFPDKKWPFENQGLSRAPIPQTIAASPGATLFAVSGEQKILLFGAADDPSEIEPLGGIPVPLRTIHNLKFSRDGTLMIASGGHGSLSGKVVVVDVKTGKLVAEVGEEVDSVLAADISHDHRWLATGNSSKRLKIYDLQSGELVHRIKKHTDWITSVSFSRNSDWLASGDRSGGVFVWEAKKGAVVFGLSEHKVQVNDLAWRADDKVLATAAEDGNVIQWNMKDGFIYRNGQAHFNKKPDSPYSRNSGVLSVQFMSDGSILSVGRDRKAKFWDASGKLINTFSFTQLPTNARLVGRQILVGTMDGNLSFFNLDRKTDSPIKTLSTWNRGSAALKEKTR